MTDIVKEMLQRLAENIRSNDKSLGHSDGIRRVSEYTDPARYKLEVDRLFSRLPIVVAHRSQLPNPGDFITHDLLGKPLLIARDQSGQVNAFINLCRHRSAIVETKSCGNKKMFQCPYHAWTYNLDGSLADVPERGSFDMDLTGRGLRSVACAEKHGLIFVSLESPTIDLDAFLGDFGAELDLFRTADHKFFSGRETPLKCNWKLMMEGSLEVYHFKFLHSESAGGAFLPMNMIHDMFDPHQRHVMARKKFLKDLDGDTPKRANMLPNYFIYPNTVLTFPHDHVTLTQVFPTGPNTCVFYNSLLTLDGDDSEETQAHWTRSLEYTERVNGEDFDVLEGIQRGYEQAPDDMVIHGRFEQGLISFHENTDRILAGAAR